MPPGYKPYNRNEITDEELSDEELERRLLAKKAEENDEITEPSFHVLDLNDENNPPVKAPENVCTVCEIGRLEKKFTLIGILMGIFLFPIGIICCFAARITVCNNCGTVFD